MDSNNALSLYRWRVASVLLVTLVVVFLFDTSDNTTLIDHIAGVCFLVTSIIVVYKTYVMLAENTVNAVSIMLIPIILLIILSLAGVVHFLPIFVIYTMGLSVAGGYPGKQDIIPHSMAEWLMLLATLFVIMFFIVLVMDARLQRAISDFMSFTFRHLRL